jgi:hypothetical protein
MVTHPRTEILHGRGLFETERDLIRDNAEFGPHRIGHFTGDQSDGDSERMPGPQAARDYVQRIRELFAESRDPAPAGV